MTYVNRSYVTVVNQNTFVTGGLVNRGWVRDQAVVQQVVAAPVVRGPLPFVPTAASLRVAVRPNVPAAPRPPAMVLSRPVVARIAPPPAPPAFSAKVEVIRQNAGAPVAAAAAARLIQERGRPQPVTAFKPVTASGGVTLLARRPAGSRRQRRGPVWFRRGEGERRSRPGRSRPPSRNVESTRRVAVRCADCGAARRGRADDRTWPRAGQSEPGSRGRSRRGGESALVPRTGADSRRSGSARQSGLAQPSRRHSPARKPAGAQRGSSATRCRTPHGGADESAVSRRPADGGAG